MPDLWPHDTAVSWLRTLMKKQPLRKGNGLEHMQKEFVTTLASCVKHINDNYEVEDLCRAFPRRVDEMRGLTRRTPQPLIASSCR